MSNNVTLALALMFGFGCLAAYGQEDPLSTEIRLLREQVAAQQKQIDQLRTMMEELKTPQASPAPALAGAELSRAGRYCLLRYHAGMRYERGRRAFALLL